MLPQLDFTTFPSQLFWLFVSFFALYCIIRFVFFPNISSIFRKRSLIEEGNLAKSSKIDKKFRDQLALREHKIGLAKSKAKEIRSAAKDKVLSMKREFEKEVSRRVAELKMEADVNISNFSKSSKDDALLLALGVSSICSEEFSLNIAEKEYLDNLTVDFIENYYASGDFSN